MASFTLLGLDWISARIFFLHLLLILFHILFLKIYFSNNWLVVNNWMDNTINLELIRRIIRVFKVYSFTKWFTLNHKILLRRDLLPIRRIWNQALIYFLYDLSELFDMRRSQNPYPLWLDIFQKKTILSILTRSSLKTIDHFLRNLWTRTLSFSWFLFWSLICKASLQNQPVFIFGSQIFLDPLVLLNFICFESL